MTPTKAFKDFSRPHEDNNRVVPFESPNITKEKLKALLPRKTTIAVTDEIMQLIHAMEEDTGLPQEMLEEDIMSYTHLLQGSTNGMKDLVNAIKFCNLKRNYDNKTAWSIVFPSKYDRLVTMEKDTSNHVSMYNNSKLVVAIDKEMLIPVHLQYAGYFHAAVKKQFELMNGRSSQGKGRTTPMVEHLAAKELALLTAQPVDTKIDLRITPSDAALEAQGEMNQQLKDIVAYQRKQLLGGADIIETQVLGISFDGIGHNND